MKRNRFIATLLLTLGFASVLLLPELVSAQGLIQPCPNPDDVPGAPGCRDANILLLQAIIIAQYLFSIIGALAFIMFVYGGFTFILSMGHPDRAKKGLMTVLMAIIGLVIALSAYVVVGFVLDALGVEESFRAVL